MRKRTMKGVVVVVMMFYSISHNTQIYACCANIKILKDLNPKPYLTQLQPNIKR